MWEAAGKWLIENHGAAGIIIIAQAVVVCSLAGALVYIFKRYNAAQAKLEGQATKCRACMQAMDTRHTAELDGYYATMRDENKEQWRSIGDLMDRSTTAITNFTAKLGELAGKLDIIGRHT